MIERILLFFERILLFIVRILVIIVQFVLLSVGPAVLAYAVGFITGMTGGDKTVLAAVLPAALAAAGSIHFAYARLHKHESGEKVEVTRTLPSVSLIVAIFAISLLVGSKDGTSNRHFDDAEKWKNTRVAIQDRIEECSKFQLKINKQRELINLNPLSFQQVCLELSKAASESMPVSPNDVDKSDG